MRFQEFMEEVILKVEQSNFSDTLELAAEVNGGWEGWFQIEVYFKLVEVSGVDEFNREINYPNSALRADFNFIPKTAPSTTTWVELKVQKRDDYQDAVKRFEQDMLKVDNVTVPNSNTVGAVVVIPAGDHDDILDWAKQYLKSQKTKVSCYLVNDARNSKKFLLSSSTWPSIQGNAPAVVMYYAK